MLVLSIFPGIDLLGRGFEREGFCVVRGPDHLWGGDIVDFHALPGRFDGVIGGSPCQDFSKARRAAPTGYGLEMLRQFCRVVAEAAPSWFVLENVPGVPDISVPGYVVQRLDLRADEFGHCQRRVRHYQFGSVTGRGLVIPRVGRCAVTARAVLASEASHPGRRDWASFCALQGFEPLALDALTLSARYRAVGNGVPLGVSVALARAIKSWCDAPGVTGPGSVTIDVSRYPCRCGCGRLVLREGVAAGPACRKRLERRRRCQVKS